jgi:hypothetical protein
MNHMLIINDELHHIDQLIKEDHEEK